MSDESFFEKLRNNTTLRVSGALIGAAGLLGLSACSGDQTPNVNASTATTEPTSEATPTTTTTPELVAGDFNLEAMAKPNGGTYAEFMNKIESTPVDPTKTITVRGTTMSCDQVMYYANFIRLMADYDPAVDTPEKAATCEQPTGIYPAGIANVFAAFAPQIEAFANSPVFDGLSPDVAAGLVTETALLLYHTGGYAVDDPNNPSSHDFIISYLTERASTAHRTHPSDSRTLSPSDVSDIYYAARRSAQVFHIGEEPPSKAEATKHSDVPAAENPTSSSGGGEVTNPNNALMDTLMVDLKKASVDKNLTINADGNDYTCASFMGEASFAESTGADPKTLNMCADGDLRAFSVIHDNLDTLMSNQNIKDNNVDKLIVAVTAFQALRTMDMGNLTDGSETQATFIDFITTAINDPNLAVKPVDLYHVGSALGISDMFPDIFSPN